MKNKQKHILCATVVYQEKKYFALLFLRGFIVTEIIILNVIVRKYSSRLPGRTSGVFVSVGLLFRHVRTS